jgi:hypothetical protein
MLTLMNSRSFAQNLYLLSQLMVTDTPNLPVVQNLLVYTYTNHQTLSNSSYKVCLLLSGSCSYSPLCHSSAGSFCLPIMLQKPLKGSSAFVSSLSPATNPCNQPLTKVIFPKNQFHSVMFLLKSDQLFPTNHKKRPNFS